MSKAFLRSLALHLPDRAMPNSHWLEHHPQMIEQMEERALNRTWSPGTDHELGLFEKALLPYQKDPFRGCKDRWWLAPGEASLPHEVKVAKDALKAANVAPCELDYILCTSFPPDEAMAGNGAYIAGQLEVACPAWNIESACGSWFSQLEIALSLIVSGRAKNILVVTSCAYSRVAPSSEVISVANGDGFSAAVISSTTGAEILALHSINTAASCGALTTLPEVNEQGNAVLRMRLDRSAGRKIRAISEPAARECVAKVLSEASMAKEDVVYWAMNAATAWQLAFYSEIFEMQLPAVNTHPYLANVGPVLTPAALYFGAELGRLVADETAVCFGIGNASTAGAAALRWGDCKLAPPGPAVAQALEAIRAAEPR